MRSRFIARPHRSMNRVPTRPPLPFHRIGSAYEPQEIPMVNAALTMLPVIVTFAVAAWHSPSKNVQPRSGEPGDCRCN
jgi:hypothetical protein